MLGTLGKAQPINPFWINRKAELDGQYLCVMQLGRDRVKQHVRRLFIAMGSEQTFKKIETDDPPLWIDCRLCRHLPSIDGMDSLIDIDERRCLQPRAVGCPEIDVPESDTVAEAGFQTINSWITNKVAIRLALDLNIITSRDLEPVPEQYGCA